MQQSRTMKAARFQSSRSTNNSARGQGAGGFTRHRLAMIFVGSLPRVSIHTRYRNIHCDHTQHKSTEHMKKGTTGRAAVADIADDENRGPDEENSGHGAAERTRPHGTIVKPKVLDFPFVVVTATL